MEIPTRVAGCLMEIHEEISFLYLKEIGKKRFFRLPMDLLDARSVSFAFEDIRLEPPLTHDLLIDITEKFEVYFSAIRITEDGSSVLGAFIESGSYSWEACLGDAAVIGLHYDIPLLLPEEIAKHYEVPKKDGKETEKIPQDIEEEIFTHSTRQALHRLETLLKYAVREERYEIASMLRDKIRKLKKS